LERDALRLALAAPGVIRLSSNENPLGPGEKALAAIHNAFADANRYPFAPEKGVQAAIAQVHRVPETHVSLAAAPEKSCASRCSRIRGQDARWLPDPRPSRIPGAMRGSSRLMSSKCRSTGSSPRPGPDGRRLRGAGLIFLCNPNNPTGTVHGAAAVSDFIARVNRSSPNTTILIDEAYHEYVDDPRIGPRFRRRSTIRA